MKGDSGELCFQAVCIPLVRNGDIFEESSFWQKRDCFLQGFFLAKGRYIGIFSCSYFFKHSRQQIDRPVKNCYYITSKKCGSSSEVEHNLAKVGVAGSNPVSRFFPRLFISPVLHTSNMIYNTHVL